MINLIPKNLLQNWHSWLLLPVLALAFFVAYIPHRDYPYPVHLDEWQVMVFTDELMQKGSLDDAVNPLNGSDSLTWNQPGELGCHVFWGIFKEVTGMDWLPIFRYFPGFIYMIAVLGVFTLAKRQGFGWEAAFFSSLLPTTVGILGPAFLVPIALALVFIPLVLFTVFYLRKWYSYLLLTILIVAPAAIHPPTAAVILLVLVPFGLLSLKGEWKHSLGMGLAVGLPFLVLFPVIYRLAVPMVKRLLAEQRLDPYVDLPAVVPKLGYLTVILFILGIIYLAWRGKRMDYGLVLGTGLVMAMLAVFYTLHYGVGIVYYRGLMVGMLMVCLLAGAGLGVIRGMEGSGGIPSVLSRMKLGKILQALRLPAVLAILAVALWTGIAARLSEPYYYMIQGPEYHAFRWIGENLGDEYGRGLVDPWQGIAFTSLTGKPVYSWVGETPDANAASAYGFLKGGCRDTAMLTNKKIDIIYTTGAVENQDLIEIRENVYIRG